MTGTNGKSTISHLMAAMLEAAGKPTGTLGTLGYGFADEHFAGDRTTPEATELFALLSRMKKAGAEAVSMEVSSHGLALGRVQDIRFDLGVFSNLTRDHLRLSPRLRRLLRCQTKVVRSTQAGRAFGDQRRRSIRPPVGRGGVRSSDIW